MDRACLRDLNGDWIYSGEEYYNTTCGPLRIDGVGEFMAYGDVATIMYVLWREDELGDKPYKEETLNRLREEINDMTPTEFVEQMKYTTMIAGDPAYREEERYGKYQDRSLGL